MGRGARYIWGSPVRVIRFIGAILARLAESRSGQSVLGFLAVFSAFCLYSVTVVPLIEPANTMAANTKIEADKIEKAKAAANRRLSRFDSLLESCSIRMEDPKILESDQITLLFRTYENNPRDGTVLIKPFLLIYLPDDPDMTEEERIIAATVLEARNGATLAFDAPFDLSRGKVGQIVGGTLKGDVTISGNGKLPGPEDDLRIRARNIELTEDSIISRERVAFRYGPHRGEGSQMTIRLRKQPGDGEAHAPRISGIESFSLARVDELHMQFDNAAHESDPTQPPYLPVDVKCRGSLTFRTATRQAAFENGVDVLLGRPRGQSDHLSCQMLLIHFADRHETTLSKKEAERKRAEGDIVDLEPYRIEARGAPVRLLAPSHSLSAEGEILDYDFGTQRVLLESLAGDAQLNYGKSRLTAKKLQYSAAEDGRLGEIRAEGPGTLEGLLENEDEPLRAAWGHLLEVRPDLESENGQLVSLSGGVLLEYADLGKLESDKIYLWLRETGNKGVDGMPELRPDRMLAETAVSLRSRQMNADVTRMEIWFDEVSPEVLSQESVSPEAPPVLAATGDGWRHSPSDPASPGPDGTIPLHPRQANPYYEPPADRNSAQRFQVGANVLQANLRVLPDGMSIAKLALDGNVRLLETQTSKPDEEPIVLEGDRVSVVDADASHAAVAILGTRERPARFQGRGLSLQAETINLNRGTNSLWTDAPGILQVQVKQDLAGQPLAGAGPLTIEWQTRMSFDGQTASFEDAVTASTQFQHLRTQVLEARLRQPIRFASESDQPAPELSEIRCRGGVVLENHLFDMFGRVSQDKIEVSDLKLNLLTGDLIGNGPANVTTVRRGFADPTDTASPAPAIPLHGAGPKTYLRVRCQGPVSGNVLKREVSFNEQTRAVYGPVGSWEASLDLNDPDVLDDRGAVLGCDRLTVAQMAVPGGEPSLELAATGNTVVEGRTFMARGARVSYAQSKDLLILEGDGRNDAELFRQMTLGGQTNRAAAKKIHYWPKTKRVNMDGIRGGEFEFSPEMGLRQSSGMPRR